MSDRDRAIHSYYLLHVCSQGGAHEEISGMIEDLRTGRRFPFATLSALTRLVRPRAISDFSKPDAGARPDGGRGSGEGLSS
ncbi:MAG: hypothetical protein IT361_15545 [Gemmatimonadaceae bacterium]|nr:hypothetical protein [Gemmatimonadaceae bacterium]